jgi:hypothetical protein
MSGRMRPRPWRRPGGLDVRGRYHLHDTAAMTGPSNDAAIAQKLFPNQVQFKKEEQRRFELLDAHWDVPLNELRLDSVK